MQMQIYNTINIYEEGFINSDTGSIKTEVRFWSEKLNGMAKGIPKQVEKLKPIIQLIVSAIAPAKIYMLKQEVEEDQTSGFIDLLIVVSAGSGVSFTELEPILEMAYLKDSRVSCSLHNQGCVIESLNKGHLFYCLHFTKENLVYDDQKLEYPIIPQERMSEIKREAKEKFKQAFSKAQDFFELATILHQDYQSDILGFLIHQAVELTYRAVLRSLNGYDKKTHEIRVLKKQVRRVAHKLNTIFPDDTDAEKRLLDQLESAYLDARYGDSGSMDDEVILVMLKKVDQLQDLAKQIAEAKLRIL